ncbi:MAG: DUF2752 domain-containing protein [Phycisphaeraceae bacterium]|nr:DUF2752 domain-containing protein [Phycisphaeraceae bacterium]
MDMTETGRFSEGSGASRLLALVLALVCASPLVFAATLTPSAAGMGTHTQMGLSECGFVLATGLPCATCGCTTAFAHAADGSLLTSLITQPFGAALALALAMMALIAGWSAVSGMRLEPVGRLMATKAFVLPWLVLLLAAWGYKAAVVAAGG